MKPDLKPQDAAAYLGKSVSTLSQWRRKGSGPTYIKVGGTVRYSTEALDAFLRANTCDPRPKRTRPLSTLLCEIAA